jgi:hypothetical protein
MFRIPVITGSRKVLMPTHQANARALIKSARATPFFHKGIFCIRLNKWFTESVQPVSIGIDPGSKKEAFTVMCEYHTLLNLQLDAVTHVKDAVEAKRNARRARRNRNTPCRKPRYKQCRRKGWVPPSTKARWDNKINTIKALCKIYPISVVVAEDVSARTIKNGKVWNKSFSPVQCGKNYFIETIKSLNLNLILKEGWETAALRATHSLSKSKNKMSDKWDAHCVDSWVLASVPLTQTPKVNQSMIVAKPLRFHRRQLHVFQPTKGGIRKLYGSTRSLGLRRGSIVKHTKFGKCLVGGSSKGRISLHNISDNKRLCQNAKLTDVTFLCYNNLNFYFATTR